LVVKVLYSQSLADTGEIDDAIDALRGVLTELPAEVDPMQLQYDLANLLFLEKRYDEAKTAYSRLILRGNRASQIISQAKSRLGMMKEKEGSKKKDFDSLEMMDLETAVEAGQVPEGAVDALQDILERNPKSAQAEEAKRLQVLVKELRVKKAQALLDEARRLFDVEKRYVEVTEILDSIERSYGDVSEKPSIEALRKAVASKTGKQADR
jgi:tetratricopeptide (TPR) repeat protein